MSLTPEIERYFDWLDEQPQRRAGGFIVGVKDREEAPPRGDRTEVGKAEYRSRFPRREWRAQWLKLTGYLLEKEDT